MWSKLSGTFLFVFLPPSSSWGVSWRLDAEADTVLSTGVFLAFPVTEAILVVEQSLKSSRLGPCPCIAVCNRLRPHFLAPTPEGKVPWEKSQMMAVRSKEVSEELLLPGLQMVVGA